MMCGGGLPAPPPIYTTVLPHTTYHTLALLIFGQLWAVSCLSFFFLPFSKNREKKVHVIFDLCFLLAASWKSIVFIFMIGDWLGGLLVLYTYNTRHALQANLCHFYRVHAWPTMPCIFVPRRCDHLGFFHYEWDCENRPICTRFRWNYWLIL